jgi:hypothetical protein
MYAIHLNFFRPFHEAMNAVMGVASSLHCSHWGTALKIFHIQSFCCLLYYKIVRATSSIINYFLYIQLLTLIHLDTILSPKLIRWKQLSPHRIMIDKQSPTRNKKAAKYRKSRVTVYYDNSFQIEEHFSA